MRFQIEMKVLCQEIGKSTPLQLREAINALEPVSSAWSGWALRFVPQLTRASLKCDLLLWAGTNMRGGRAGLL